MLAPSEISSHHPGKEKLLVLPMETSFGGLLVTIQLVGTVALLLIRITTTGRWQQIGQGLFLLWMAVVGVATLSVVHVGCQRWLPMGTTLAVMVLGATIDLSRIRVRSPY